MLRRAIERLWLAAFLLVALLFLIDYFHDHTGQLREIAHVDLSWLLAAIVSHGIYYLLTVGAWRRVLYTASGKLIAFGEGLLQIVLVNFGKYIPGKVWGMAARGKRLAQRGYSLASIARATWIEQLLLLLTGAWLMALVATVLLSAWTWPLLLVILSGVLLALRPLTARLRQVFATLPRFARLAEAFEFDLDILETLQLALRYVLLWLALSASFIAVTAMFLELPLTTATVAWMTLSLVAGFLAGFVAIFAPGGVGVREGVGAALLSNVMPLEQAVLAMLLFRLWIVATELLAGAVAAGLRDND